MHQAPPGPVAGRARCPVLVGRDDELALLRERLSAAAAGRGGTVVLRGEAGIGKSRLVAELIDDAAARGATLLRGRCVAQGQTPLRPFAEALLAVARGGGLPDAAELRPFRHALGSLVPDWREDDRGRGSGADDGSDSPVLTAEGLLRLARVLAGRAATVLAVEDLHWADAGTLAAFEYLADHAGDQPLLLLGTVRAGEAAGVDQLAADLEQRGAAEALALAPLGPGDVADMVAACADGCTPETVAAVAARSDGVPLLVEELVSVPGRGVHHAVPASFAEAVARRLAVLGAEATLVARSAALLGRSFDWRLLVEVTGLPADRAQQGLADCLAVQLFEADDRGGCSFRHALARDAVLASTLGPVRATLAARAARAVEQVAEDAALAADLWLAAGEPDHAARVLVDSGRAASRRGRLSAAAELLERARGLPTVATSSRLAATETLAHVHARATRLDAALDVGDEALRLLEEVPHAASRRAALHLALARAGVAAARWPMVAEHLAAARPLVGDDAAMRAARAALEAQTAIARQDLDGAERLATEAVALARDADDAEAWCEGLEVLGRRERLRDLARAEVLFAEAHDLATARDLPWWRLRTLHELGTIEMLERSGSSRLRRASELAYATGALSVAATVDLQLAGLHAFRWELDEARAAARRAIDVAGTVGLHQVHTTAWVQLAFAHALAARRQEMEGALERALSLGGDEPETRVLAWGHVRATCSLLEEDRPRAREELRRAASSAAEAPGTTGAFIVLADLLRAVDPAPGDEVTATDLARPEPIPVNAAIREVAVAVAEGRAGEGPAAAERVGRAAEVLRSRELDGWLHLARRLAAEAALADGWGDPGAWLAEAREHFTATGHPAVADACRDLLRRAGLRVPRADRRGLPDDLRAAGVTPREAEVLRLLGERLSNQEIADRLYLSRRTVEKHVERLAAKTASANRVDLGRLARDAFAARPGT